MALRRFAMCSRRLVAEKAPPGSLVIEGDQLLDLARIRGTQRQFSENICSEDDLRSRIFGTFVVKFLACLPLLGFSNI